jgi:hypothetical protein
VSRCGPLVVWALPVVDNTRRHHTNMITDFILESFEKTQGSDYSVPWALLYYSVFLFGFMSTRSILHSGHFPALVQMTLWCIGHVYSLTTCAFICSFGERRIALLHSGHFSGTSLT